MDPQATLKALLDAQEENDWGTARELALALQNWLDRDGFAPVTMGAKSFGHEWHTAIVRLICEMALSRARAAIRSEPRKECV